MMDGGEHLPHEDKSNVKSTVGSTSKKDLGIDLKSIKSKLPNLKLKKDKALNQSRFTGDGVIFKAKLIGVEEIDSARGDKLCQETLQRLKQVVKTSGTHKQRINLSVSLSGVKLLEEKTGVLLYHHPVHQISFISQDNSDDRAFGYICSPASTVFHFVAIKTEKAAAFIVLTLRDLFQVVLDIKKKQKLKIKESKETEINDSFEETSSPRQSTSVKNIENQLDLSGEQGEEAIYAEVGPNPLQNAQVPSAQGTGVSEDVLKTANDLLCGDLLDLNFDEIQPIKSEAIFLDKPVLFQPLPAATNTVSEEITKVEESKPEEIQLTKTEFDKYAVFEEIDNVPSIFEQPVLDKTFTTTIKQSTSPPLSPFSVKFVDSDIPNGKPISNSSDVTDWNSGSIFPPPSVPTIFADLDPLTKDHPYIDKQEFFSEIKSPPKRNLNNLKAANTSFDYSLDIQGSPPSKGVSIFSNLLSTVSPPNYPPPVCANPFVHDSICSSPPRVPPRVPFDVFNCETVPNKSNPFNTSVVDNELPPPNTPPPVLPPFEVDNVFASPKSIKNQVLPKSKLSNSSQEGDVFHNVTSTSSSSPIAVLTVRKAHLVSSFTSSTSSAETSGYSSSWSFSSKFNAESKNESCKYYSNEEISENQPAPLPKTINPGPRADWNTFETDDPIQVAFPDKNVENERTESLPTDLQVENQSTPFKSQTFASSAGDDVPVDELSSPEERNIFKRKQDPFADDFFLSLAK